ncbi:MAG: hypothetical protein R3D80_12345 [Paracoccaceae bacterium]
MVDAVARDESAVTAPQEPPNPDHPRCGRGRHADPEPVEVVNRISTSGGRHWGVNVGRFNTRDGADRMLIRTALAELASLGEALRKVVNGPKGFEANFVGLTRRGRSRLPPSRGAGHRMHGARTAQLIAAQRNTDEGRAGPGRALFHARRVPAPQRNTPRCTIARA